MSRDYWWLREIVQVEDTRTPEQKEKDRIRWKEIEMETMMQAAHWELDKLLVEDRS